MRRYDEWRGLVDLDPAARITIEYPCRYWDLPEAPPKSVGLPRIDAIAWHGDKRCSLIETKVKTDPSAIMGGVGQLLYYKAWMERVEGVQVAALLLIAPSLPPLVLEAIQDVRANIRYLKVVGERMSGLVPQYGELDVEGQTSG